jgi:putative sigma-54 modulation protein
MRIDIQSGHLDISRETADQLKTKITKLEHFYENIVDVIVYLHEYSDRKEVEIKANVKDTVLFVKEEGETFVAAMDVAMDIMKKQLKKYKEKHLNQ